MIFLSNIDNIIQRSLGSRGYYSKDTGIGLLNALEYYGDFSTLSFTNFSEDLYKSYLRYDVLLFKLREEDINLNDCKNIIFKLRRLKPDIKIFNLIETSVKDEAKSLIDFSRNSFFTGVYIDNLYQEGDLKELTYYSHSKDLEVGIAYSDTVPSYNFLSGRDYMFFKDMFYSYTDSQGVSSESYIEEVFEFILGSDIENRLPFKTIGLNNIDNSYIDKFSAANNSYLFSSILGLDGTGISNKDSGVVDNTLTYYSQPYFPTIQRYRYLGIVENSVDSATGNTRYDIDLNGSIFTMLLGDISERYVMVNESIVESNDDGIISEPGAGEEEGSVIKREEFIATEGQAVFDLTQGTYSPGENKISVYIWGKKQPNASFTEVSETSIEFLSGLSSGDRVLIEWFEVSPLLRGPKGESGAFSDEKSNDIISGNVDVNWNESSRQSILLTEDISLNFVDPPSAGDVTLKLVQDSTGGKIVTLPEAKWPGGAEPDLSTGPNNIDIIKFYYDGSEYFGYDKLNFS